MISEVILTEYGSTSRQLKFANLSTLCVDKIGVQTGPFGTQLHNEDYVEVGTPIITVEHLGENRISHLNTPFVSEEDKNRLSKYHLKEGDIVFSRVGSVDRRALVRKEEDGWLFSGRCLRVRVNKEKIDPVYLSYFFGLESFKNYIRSIAVGATMPSINTKILSNVPIYYPELNEQKKIAEIFNSIDEKINLNRQTNQTLEQIAQAIFKSWFVDFEPTRAKIKAKKHWQAAQQNIKASSASDYAEPSDKQHQHTTSLQEAMNRAAMAAISGKTEAELNNLPADTLQQLRTTAELFPDTLVESELGEIPAGWSIGSIGDIAKAKGGYAFKGKSFLEEGNPVIKIKNITGDGRIDLAGTVCIDDEQAKIAERFKLDDGDLLMAMTGATVAKIGFVVTAGKSVYLNQRVAKFESEKFGSKISWFLYCCFQRDSIFDSVVGAAQGSAQPNISSSGIESTELVLPTDKLVETFCTKVDSLFRQWILNINENSMLIETRDTLLPKLLSGELEVNNKQKMEII